MSESNYNKLLEKYLSAESSPAEEKELASFDAEEDVFTAFDTLRNEKMNWDFDAFLEDAKTTPVVSAHSNNYKRFFTAIAAAVVIGAVAFNFWKQTPPVIQPQQPMVKTEAPINNTQLIIDKRNEKQSPALVSNQSQEIEQKHTTIAKHTKPNRTKAAIKSRQSNDDATAPAYVIVNGRAITNKQEAEAIAGQSLAMLSQNLTAAVGDIKTINEFKVSFMP